MSNSDILYHVTNRDAEQYCMFGIDTDSIERNDAVLEMSAGLMFLLAQRLRNDGHIGYIQCNDPSLGLVPQVDGTMKSHDEKIFYPLFEEGQLSDAISYSTKRPSLWNRREGERAIYVHEKRIERARDLGICTSSERVWFGQNIRSIPKNTFRHLIDLWGVGAYSTTDNALVSKEKAKRDVIAKYESLVTAGGRIISIPFFPIPSDYEKYKHEANGQTGILIQ